MPVGAASTAASVAQTCSHTGHQATLAESLAVTGTAPGEKGGTSGVMEM